MGITFEEFYAAHYDEPPHLAGMDEHEFHPEDMEVENLTNQPDSSIS